MGLQDCLQVLSDLCGMLVHCLYVPCSQVGHHHLQHLSQMPLNVPQLCIQLCKVKDMAQIGHECDGASRWMLGESRQTLEMASALLLCLVAVEQQLAVDLLGAQLKGLWKPLVPRDWPMLLLVEFLLGEQGQANVTSVHSDALTQHGPTA